MNDLIVSGDTALDANPYIYTANNPVSRIDPSGKGWRDTLNNAWNWGKKIGSSGYNFFVGDDLNTVRDSNASTGSRVLAGGMLALNVVPIGGPGLKVGAKASIKVGEKALVKTAEEKAVNYVIRDEVATQSHHIRPLFTGAPKVAERAILPVKYHQEITNAFRKAVPYGEDARALRTLKGKDPAMWLKRTNEIMDGVYEKLPIEGFPREFR